MIKYEKGNLLEAGTEALVNTVNTVGVMGKGIALQFKQAFPENFKVYEKAYRNGELKPGKVLFVPTGQFVNPKYILNFPTKRHWRSKARLEDIEEGLIDLVRLIKENNIKSIAIPPLGCGFGGLDWKDVRPRIEKAVEELEDVEVVLYEPSGAPKPEDIKISTKQPNMTVGRAALIALVSQYAIAGYKLTLLEVQKLAYFLQALGEPLKLDFQKHKFGPYAENLNFVLQRLEGHYIRGYGDRSQSAAIHLLPGAEEEAYKFLQKYPETLARVNQVAQLINGFESPYGMELLSTVLWLAIENEEASENLSVAIKEFLNWNTRKREKFQTDHIEVAWNRLQQNEVVLNHTQF